MSLCQVLEISRSSPMSIALMARPIQSAILVSHAH